MRHFYAIVAEDQCLGPSRKHLGDSKARVAYTRQRRVVLKSAFKADAQVLRKQYRDQGEASSNAAQLSMKYSWPFEVVRGENLF